MFKEGIKIQQLTTENSERREFSPLAIVRKHIEATNARTMEHDIEILTQSPELFKVTEFWLAHLFERAPSMYADSYQLERLTERYDNSIKDLQNQLFSNDSTAVSALNVLRYVYSANILVPTLSLTITQKTWDSIVSIHRAAKVNDHWVLASLIAAFAKLCGSDVQWMTEREWDVARAELWRYLQRRSGSDLRNAASILFAMRVLRPDFIPTSLGPDDWEAIVKAKMDNPMLFAEGSYKDHLGYSYVAAAKKVWIDKKGLQVDPGEELEATVARERPLPIQRTI